MIFIMAQDRRVAYNLAHIESITLADETIYVRTTASKTVCVLGFYSTTEHARTVYEEMVQDLGDISGLPFDDRCAVYEMPKG